MSFEEKVFGNMPDGRVVKAYTLKNKDLEVTISQYGARIAKALFCGVSVICGFDCLDGELADTSYQGACVGRYANRISDGKFTLNGKEYTLDCNEEARGEHLHGGYKGFDSYVWDVTSLDCSAEASAITLSISSPDGDQGYPGKFDIDVTYTIANNAIRIDYKGVSDADTIVNMTNHSYFNLSGVGGTITDHKLTMYCDKYVPVNLRLIPFGYFENVEGTPFDFTSGKEIGKDICSDNDQIKTAGGYDHCFVRNNGVKTEKPEIIATVESPLSGITMNIYTTEGGIQMYTGNFMTAPNPFFGTIEQKQFGAVALECNAAPDTPNQIAFPSCTLKAGEEYKQTTCYSFTKN